MMPIGDAEAAHRYRLMQAERMIEAWRDYCAGEGRSDAIDLADPAQAAEFVRVWRARLAWSGFAAGISEAGQ
jgi:hypothetical protein